MKQAGYDGVEMNIPADPGFGARLRELLEQNGLLLIAQQYLPPAVESPEVYTRKMEAYLERLATFRPLFINSHTGKDYYGFDTNCRIIERAEEIGARAGIPVLHEIHRGRFSFSTFSIRPFFEKFPDMHIIADFSHWCCVSETYLDDQPEIMEEAIRRSSHIHARVGHTEGPQVPHPEAPEWREALDKHLAWWDAIIEYQKGLGREQFTISPEFGAIPYLPTLPFTNQPVAAQWDLNTGMMELLRRRFQPGEEATETEPNK